MLLLAIIINVIIFKAYTMIINKIHQQKIDAEYMKAYEEGYNSCLSKLDNDISKLNDLKELQNIALSNIYNVSKRLIECIIGSKGTITLEELKDEFGL